MLVYENILRLSPTRFLSSSFITCKFAERTEFKIYSLQPQIVTVVDAIFHGHPDVKRKEMFVPYIKDTTIDFILNLRSPRVEKELRPLIINFNSPPKLPFNVPPTPQSTINEAIILYNRGEWVLAAETAWKAASFVVKRFYNNHKLDPCSHSLKSSCIKYLIEHCLNDDDIIKIKNGDVQMKYALNAHSEGYGFEIGLDEVKRFLESAAIFSQLLCFIYDENRFDRKHFLTVWDRNTIKKMLVYHNGRWIKYTKLFMEKPAPVDEMKKTN
ncbi:hypothetical protein Mgra_00001097 [Meloidogyne graminicola]|uniref:Uncharacterized protein n=1 Tax=Meloidogyne graminicola TaxID=189291 RepID=A0A8T0A096_9BILA|nr:hypothetical protein Mgra_00001097 [Meloidogyne graminicola]